MIMVELSRTIPFQGLRVLLMFGVVAFRVYLNLFLEEEVN